MIPDANSTARSRWTTAACSREKSNVANVFSRISSNGFSSRSGQLPQGSSRFCPGSATRNGEFSMPGVKNER